MIKRIVLGFGIVGGLIAAAGCNNYSTPELFDPRLIAQSERAAANNPPWSLPPLSTTRKLEPTVTTRPTSRPTTGPVMEHDPRVALTLQEIIHRAVMNNHDVKVASYSPAVDGTRIIEAAANFDPTFFDNVTGTQKNDMAPLTEVNNLSGGVAAAGTQGTILSDQNISTQVLEQIGVKQNLGWGGQAQIQYEETYFHYVPMQSYYNPYYSSDLTVQITQPLLRNFGADVNQARITIDRDNARISQFEFRKAVETNIADVEKTYWQLVQAMRVVQIQEDLVAEGEETYATLYSRFKSKTDVSQLQVSQAQTSLETRKAQLVRDQAQARNLSDQLKQLMSDPEFPIASTLLIMPADEPVAVPVNFDVNEAVGVALENRFELGEQQLKIDAATITIDVAKNNLLPQVNFVGSFGGQGLMPNYADTTGKMLQFNHLEYSAGLQIEIPLGNRAARAIWRRTLLQRMQTIEQYRAYVEQVAVDVKIAARNVTSAWSAIEHSRQARFAAEEALRNLKNYPADQASRPEIVQLKLDTQDRLASAQQGEAQAISDYNIAISDLEKAKGTILRYNNVLLEEQLPKLPDPDKAGLY